MQRFDIIVIGQGYAGLMAAKLAAEAKQNVAVIEAGFPGGLVTNINELDPWPEGQEHTGSELASNLALELMETGVTTVSAAATSLSQSADGAWVVQTDDGAAHTATRVILATGARFRRLGVPGEADFVGRGVSECADCDGPLYRGAEAVVVGGGDSAFQEAHVLATFASKVTLAMRGDTARARPAFVETVRNNSKVVVRPNTLVNEIVGDASGVTAVRLQGPEGETLLPCAGVFVFVGLEPSTSYLPPEIDRDQSGAVVTADDLGVQPGLWAVGAVRSGFGGLLSEARAEAERAVASALAYRPGPARTAARPAIDVAWSPTELQAFADAAGPERYAADIIENLKREGRLMGRLHAEEGVAKELRREDVVVHIGAPFGSISGWVGTTFWQVWIEEWDAAGTVNARVDAGPRTLWKLDGGAPKEQILEAACDRMVAMVKAQRAAQLTNTLSRIASLQAAADEPVV